MKNVRFIIKEVINSNKILNSYDLIVKPVDPSMGFKYNFKDILFQKIGIKKYIKYITKKYKISRTSKSNYMKLYDIRIIPGFNLDTDIMFIKKEHFLSNDELLKYYNEIFKTIYKNEYKNILFLNADYTFKQFFDNKNIKEIYNIINSLNKKYILNMDLVFETKQGIIKLNKFLTKK